VKEEVEKEGAVRGCDGCEAVREEWHSARTGSGREPGLYPCSNRRSNNSTVTATLSTLEEPLYLIRQQLLENHHQKCWRPGAITTENKDENLRKWNETAKKPTEDERKKRETQVKEDEKKDSVRVMVRMSNCGWFCCGKCCVHFLHLIDRLIN